MKATTAKGLSDLRTASTRRIRCKTRRNGTAHLDIYLLNMEKQRLDTDGHLGTPLENLRGDKQASTRDRTGVGIPGPAGAADPQTGRSAGPGQAALEKDGPRILDLFVTEKRWGAAR